MFGDDDGSLEDGIFDGSGDGHREWVSPLIVIGELVANFLFENPEHGRFVDEGWDGFVGFFVERFPGGRGVEAVGQVVWIDS